MRMIALVLLLMLCSALSAQVTTLGVFFQPANSNIQVGSSDAPVYSVNLTRTGGAAAGVNFTALDFSNLGTAGASDYTQFRLYFVSGTGSPTLLASCTSPNTLFTGFTHALPANVPQNFAISVDVPPGATVGNTFQLRVVSTGVTVSAGTVAAGTVTGNTHTIVPVAGANIDVRDSIPTSIPSGAASTYDLAAAQGGTPLAGQSYTFTIHSTGTIPLNLTGTPAVQTFNPNNCTVAITQPPITTIPVGNNTPFSFLIDPIAAGNFTFNVVIQNNSATNPYLFTVSGNGVSTTATQLAITTQPGGGTGGVAWAGGNQPVVEARNGAGALDTTYTGPVQAAITAGPSSTLLGTTTRNCVAGVATFTDLAINLAGTGYVLTFTSGGLTPAVSSAFAITVGAATQLNITTQPGNGTGGLPLSTAPVVAVQDAGGNTITTDTGRTITASIATGPGTIAGGATANTATGSATFSALVINLVGTYTLDFDATGLAGDTSGSFVISIGPADSLLIVTQPGGASSATPFVTQPVVHIVDAGGNRRTSDSTTLVDAGIMSGTGTAGAVLGGTVQRQAAAGIVTFTNLEIDLPGSGYRLDFQDTGMTLPMEMSNPFGVAGTPTQLGIATQPGGAVVSTAFVTQPVVEIRDVLGNVVSADSSTNVTAALVAGTGNLTGTVTRQAVNGLVTFTNLVIDAAGAGFQIQFTSSPVLSPVSSATFSVAGVASQLGIATQPAGAAPATAFTTQPVVEIRDGAGVLVATDNTTQVTVSITAGTGAVGAVLSGTLTVTAVNGVATFTNLSIDLAGTNYTLDFSDSGALTDTTSAAFNVATGGGGGGGGGDDGGGGGCSTDAGNGWLAWIGLLALIGVAIRTRLAWRGN